MGYFNYIFAGFDENIHKIAVDKTLTDNTIYLFPTHQSKIVAKKYYLNNFPLQNVDFFTIEEWKYSLFNSKRPLLQDVKRNLALFNSFDKDNKKYFTVETFSEFKKFAGRVFNFWEEINEELISFSDIVQQLKTDLDLDDWQNEMLMRLQQSYNNYSDYLESKQLTDAIFHYQISNLNRDELGKYHNIVVVNQFYYTRLEKKLLEKAFKLGSLVSICYQLPAETVDKDKLEVKSSFTAKQLVNYRTKRIFMKESDNYFSQISALFSDLEENNCRNVVDFNFYNKSYSGIFSQNKFNLRQSKSISNTEFFQFFSEIKNLLSSLIYLRNKNQYLISLEQLKDSLLSQNFVSYFLQTCTPEKQKSILDKAKDNLYDLIENNYHFLELHSDFLQWQNFDEDVEELFQNIFSFLKNLMNLGSIEKFIEFIHNDMELDNIISKENKQNTNILEIIYQSLVDFNSTSRLNLIEEDKSYFASKKNCNAKLERAERIFRFFLEHLRNKNIKFSISKQENNQINIINLHSTRNIQYKSLAILDVTEGVLPPIKKSTFLLFENQRKKVGLKTYEDVALREKYYFFRVVAQTESVYIYHINDIDENINSSSFLEEMKLFLPQKLFSNEFYLQQDYKDFFKEILEQPANFHSFTPSQLDRSNFFNFNFKPTSLKANKLDLFSPTKLQQLINNPFIFYLKYVLGFWKREKEVSSYFNLKFIGLFAHKLFEEVWKQLKINRDEIDFSAVTQILASDKFLKKVKNRLYASLNLKYKKFHKLSDSYLLDIYFNFAMESVKLFFHKLSSELKQKNINTKSISTEKSSALKPKLTEFLSPDSFADEKVSLAGRADLLIREKTDNLLVDYKTAKFNFNKRREYQQQIIIYSLLYFMLTREINYTDIKSFLYFIGDDYFYKVPIRENDVAKFKNEIDSLLTQIKNEGFKVNASDNYDITEITRSDLL